MSGDKKLVKLYIYEQHPEKIFVDTIEALEWNDIVLIQGSKEWENSDLEALRDFCQINLPTKKIAIIPPNAGLSIYGVTDEPFMETND